MRQYIWIIFLYSSLLFARSDALVVGVGKYQNSNITPLHGVTKDIKNIKKVLKSLKVENITTLKNSHATLENLRGAFRSYIDSNKNQTENLFIFYYSGHGLQVIDENGDERDKKDEASALYDMALKSGLVSGGILLDDELYGLLTKIKSKKILIFDKCHSDSSHRGVVVSYAKVIKNDFALSTTFLREIKTLPSAENALNNCIVLSATQDKETAEDSPQGGLFTQSLLQGVVYKKAVDSRGDVTLKSLERFCDTNIDKLAVYIRKNYKGTQSIAGLFTPKFRPSKYLDRKLSDIFGINNQHPVESTPPNLLEDTLDELVAYDVIAKPKLLNGKTEYRLKQSISFAFESKKSGYLNILIAYQDSYKLFIKNQEIKAKKRYLFPEGLMLNRTLRAKEPLGLTKVYLVLSQRAWDIDSNIGAIKSDDLALTNSFTKELIPSYAYKFIKKKEQVVEAKIVKKLPNILTISKVEFDVIR